MKWEAVLLVLVMVVLGSGVMPVMAGDADEVWDHDWSSHSHITIQHYFWLTPSNYDWRLRVYDPGAEIRAK